MHEQNQKNEKTTKNIENFENPEIGKIAINSNGLNTVKTIMITSFYCENSKRHSHFSPIIHILDSSLQKNSYYVA